MTQHSMEFVEQMDFEKVAVGKTIEFDFKAKQMGLRILLVPGC